MGEMAVPADALYGASTQRAVLNFPISGQPMPRRSSAPCALIKLAAAETNAELGLLDAESRTRSPRPRRRSPRRVTTRVPDRRLSDGLRHVDQHEHERGRRAPRDGRAAATAPTKVHPNDHVNRCQSSNDVIPTALQLSAAVALDEELIPALDRRCGRPWPRRPTSSGRS